MPTVPPTLHSGTIKKVATCDGFYCKKHSLHASDARVGFAGVLWADGFLSCGSGLNVPGTAGSTITMDFAGVSNMDWYSHGERLLATECFAARTARATTWTTRRSASLLAAAQVRGSHEWH